MSLIALEDFGGYGSDAALRSVWGANAVWFGTGDSWGGPAMGSFSANICSRIIPGLVLGDTFVYAFRSKQSAWQSLARVFACYDQGGVEHLRLSTNAAKILELKRGTVLVASGTTVLVDNTEYYFSIKGKIADAGGLFDLQLEGVAEATFTGDTQNGGTSPYPAAFHMENQNSLGRLSHVMLCKANDAIFPNDHVAPFRLEGLIANANGDLSGYTPLGGGTLAAELDDGQLADGNASYVSLAAATGSFLVNMAATVDSPNSIFGVMIEADHAKSDAGVCTARIDCKLGATTVNGPTVAPTTQPSYMRSYLPLSNKPGGTGWLPADIAGIQAGMSRLT
jgi:hypothetical protein